MSKKELLERLSRSSTGGRARRAVTPPSDEEGTRTSESTRVSRGVVRRRRKAPPSSSSAPRTEAPKSDAPTSEDAAPSARSGRVASRRRVVRRKAAAETPPEDVEVQAEESAAPETVTAAPEPVSEPASTPEPAEAASEPVDASAPASDDQPADASSTPVEAAPEASEATRDAASEEAPAASASAEQGAPETPAPVEPASAAPPAEATPQTSEPAEAVPPALSPPTGANPQAESPRFEGLGRAVVAPPPGYDPANPTAFRRRLQAQRSATSSEASSSAPARGRRRVAAPVTGPAASAPPRGRGRRGAPRSRRPFGGDRRWNRKRRRSSGPKKASPAPKAQKRRVRIDNVISVGQLAHEMAIKSSVIIKFLMNQDIMATQNQLLEFEIAQLVAAEFDYEVINAGFQEENYLQHIGEEEEESDFASRPPVVTVMGHVDHGKTTLLDAIRNAKVASGEAGGITQHIGAYQVEWSDNPITFLDTPGHAAFSSMRARGAQVTDLVVLVVAVDDGVQPQTAEAVSHANAAGVPIVVAINKMDKPGANADSIKQRLGEFGLVPEEWGGETLMVPISALNGDGIDDLLETILLQAEVLDLSANPDRFAEGIVIEAKMERGRGPIATVLVQKGTLKRGDHVVLGAVHGRVRSLTNDRGKAVKEAGPSTPVEVFGLSDLPQTGDSLDVLENDKKARKLAEHRAENRRLAALGGTTRKSAEEMLAGLGEDEKKTINVVLKADVQGSLEAVRAAVESIDVTGCEVRVLHAAVGNVSESDVHLLAADEGLLLGFNVKVDARARRAADEAGVRPELFKVIYQLLDRVEGALKGMLEPVYEEVHQGSAEVRATFSISRIGTIAGCLVQEGKVGRNHGARLFRDGKLVWEGRIGSLKRFKDDVREVSTGYECGISLDGYNEIEDGDVIQTFAMVEVAAE